MFAEPFAGARMARLGRATPSPDDHQPVGVNELSQTFVADRPVETFAYNLFTYDAGYDRFTYEVTVMGARPVDYRSPAAVALDWISQAALATVDPGFRP